MSAEKEPNSLGPWPDETRTVLQDFLRDQGADVLADNLNLLAVYRLARMRETSMRRNLAEKAAAAWDFWSIRSAIRALFHDPLARMIIERIDTDFKGNELQPHGLFELLHALQLLGPDGKFREPELEVEVTEAGSGRTQTYSGTTKIGRVRGKVIVRSKITPTARSLRGGPAALQLMYSELADGVRNLGNHTVSLASRAGSTRKKVERRFSVLREDFEKGIRAWRTRFATWIVDEYLKSPYFATIQETEEGKHRVVDITQDHRLRQMPSEPPVIYPDTGQTRRGRRGTAGLVRIPLTAPAWRLVTSTRDGYAQQIRSFVREVDEIADPAAVAKILRVAEQAWRSRGAPTHDSRAHFFRVLREMGLPPGPLGTLAVIDRHGGYGITAGYFEHAIRDIGDSYVEDWVDRELQPWFQGVKDEYTLLMRQGGVE